MATNGLGLPSQAAGMQTPGNMPPAAGGKASGPSAQGGAPEEAGSDEYPQGVSRMLKEVHGLLQKSGKGLPGFQEAPGLDRKA